MAPEGDPILKSAGEMVRREKIKKQVLNDQDLLDRFKR